MGAQGVSEPGGVLGDVLGFAAGQQLDRERDPGRGAQGPELRGADGEPGGDGDVLAEADPGAGLAPQPAQVVFDHPVGLEAALRGESGPQPAQQPCSLVLVVEVGSRWRGSGPSGSPPFRAARAQLAVDGGDGEEQPARRAGGFVVDLGMRDPGSARAADAAQLGGGVAGPDAVALTGVDGVGQALTTDRAAVADLRGGEELGGVLDGGEVVRGGEEQFGVGVAARGARLPGGHAASPSAARRPARVDETAAGRMDSALKLTSTPLPPLRAWRTFATRPTSSTANTGPAREPRGR